MASQEDASPLASLPSAPIVDDSMQPADMDEAITSSGSASPSSDDGNNPIDQKSTDPTLMRPKLGSRKSSGTIIIPRDSPQVELRHEEYDEGDARTMSPRRSSEEIERMGQEARKALIEQAKALQASLLEICDRVETVRSEHEKLEGGNRFLQSYIGELMQTSKITAVGAAKGKGKART